MASYCFCGCGRRVRFGKKRLSRHGASAAETVNLLGLVSLPLVSSDPETKTKVLMLIDHGEQIRDIYQGMIHGTVAAPAMDVQRQIFSWENTAPALAAKHLEMVMEKTEGEGDIKMQLPADFDLAQHMRALDAILHSPSPVRDRDTE